MGGGSWNDIPEKYKPHWSKWKIEGTPLEETQRRLKAKGLHDPWLRNDAWIYGVCDKNSNPIKVLRRGMLPGFLLFLGIITLEKSYSSTPASSTHH